MPRSPTFSAMGRRFRRSVAVTLWAGRHYAWVQTRLDAHVGRARVTRRLLSSNFPSASWVTAIRPARVRGNRESPQNGEKGRQSRRASRHTSSAETPMVIEGFGRYHWSACRGQGRRRSVDLRFFRLIHAGSVTRRNTEISRLTTGFASPCSWSFRSISQQNASYARPPTENEKERCARCRV